VTLAFKLVPSYAEFVTVKSVMNAVSDDRGLQGKSRPEIMRSVDQRLGINDIRNLPSGAITVVQEGADRLLVADYEVRVPLFFNVDAVMAFEHRASLPR